MTTMTARAWGMHSGTSGSIGAKSTDKAFNSTGDTPDGIFLDYEDWDGAATSGYSWTASFGSGIADQWSEMTAPATALDEATISWTDNTSANTPFGFGLIHASNVPWASYPPDTRSPVGGVITVNDGEEGIIIAQSMNVADASSASTLGWTTFISRKSTGIFEMDEAQQFRVVGPGSYAHPSTTQIVLYYGETEIIPDTVGQGPLGIVTLDKSTPVHSIISRSGRTLA